MSVVEIAIERTTRNFESLPPLNAATATNEKIVATTPDITLTRTGVPSCLLKIPKNGKKAPSYDATAWIRSEPIIQTAPEVTRVPTKHSVIKIRKTCAAPPYTPWNVTLTASRKPPSPETFDLGKTSRIRRTGTAYRRTPRT